MNAWSQWFGAVRRIVHRWVFGSIN